MFVSFFEVEGCHYQFGVTYSQNILTPIRESEVFVSSSSSEELKSNLAFLLQKKDIETAIGSILFEILCNHPLTRSNQSENFEFYFGKFEDKK